MRTWLAFTDLKPGDRFRWDYNRSTDRYSAIVYTKLRSGWYTDGRNKFRSGKLGKVKLES